MARALLGLRQQDQVAFGNDGRAGRRPVSRLLNSMMISRPSLMPIAKALKIDGRLEGTYTPTSSSVRTFGRLGFMLPLELDFHAFRVLPSTARLFLDIGANDGISARSFRLFNKSTPILSIEPNPCHEAALKRTKAASILSTTGLLPQASDAAS